MDFRKCSVWNAVPAAKSCSSSGDEVKEARQSKGPPSAWQRSATAANMTQDRQTCCDLRGRSSVDLERFYTDENLALYRLLATSTDVDERRAILRLLADQTAQLKRELRKISPVASCIAETRH
jgi:hypothetical protein